MRAPASRRRAARPPCALRAGDVVAVVAPGAVIDRASLERGVAALAALGFRPRVARGALRRRGYLAGSDAERAASFREVLEDAEVRAVFLARAGYGTARILPAIAPVLERAEPKIVVGYSDATALLSYATGRFGWVTFHGPMVATDFHAMSSADRRSLADLLSGAVPAPLPLGAPISEGVAEGVLGGGCLSILVSLLGTPYAFDPADGILFVEDCNEKPYRIDRMLVQLRQAGALSRIRGLVFGEMPGCGEPRELRRVIADVTDGLDVPIGFGLPSGHGKGKRTVPFGVRARLDAVGRRLELLEPAVA